MNQDENLKPGILSADERRCARAAIKASIDLRRRYVRLQAEDKKMERKQKRLRGELIHLQMAWAKLR